MRATRTTFLLTGPRADNARAVATGDTGSARVIPQTN